MVKHDEFDAIIGKDKSIGLPMTPSKWVTTKPTYEAISRIKMTCGGGIGGSSWYEYVQRVSFENVHLGEMLPVVTIDGREKLLNPNNIVTVESDLQLVSGVINSQNPNFEIGQHEYRYLCRDGVKVSFYDRV